MGSEMCIRDRRRAIRAGMRRSRAWWSRHPSPAPRAARSFSGLGCAHSFDGSMSADELFERLCPFVLRMDERHLVQ